VYVMCNTEKMWLWNPASVYMLKEHSQVPLSTVVCIFRDSDFVTSDQASCGLPTYEFWGQ